MKETPFQLVLTSTIQISTKQRATFSPKLKIGQESVLSAKLQKRPYSCGKGAYDLRKVRRERWSVGQMKRILKF